MDCALTASVSPEGRVAVAAKWSPSISSFGRRIAAQVDQWGGAGLDANLFTVSSLHRTESLA
jgi:hypothetical protein